MARYQIILAYDGTDFCGSQRQGKARTVQGELEKALRKIGWQAKSILLAGRTDAGVHASGQVAAFDLDWEHSPDELCKALNANLPVDLAVRRVDLAPASFHPRFDARSRRYRYRLFCQEMRDPLRERYAWRVWPPVSGLSPLADLWLGAHDFAAFGSPTTPRGSTVRTVHSASWQTSGDEWTFEIEADAFLYRMVRRLVYLQVAVGQGRLSAETLDRALKSRPPVQKAAQERLPGGLALPNGLTLVEVKYDNLVELV
jgi:tRNA pseudouridine38-40 synthase